MLDPVSVLLSLVPVQYAIYVTIAVALCSVLDAVVPQPAEGSRLVPLRRAVTFVAVNVGHARNAVPAGAIPAPVAAVAGQVQQAASAVEAAAGELAAKAREGTGR